MKKYVPKFARFSFLILLVSSAIYIASRAFTPLADFINGTFSVAVRYLLSSLTVYLPFSFFEMLIIVSPLLLILTVVLIVKCTHGFVGRMRALTALLGVISLIFTAYIFTLGIGYHTSMVSDMLDIEDKKDITAQELYYTVNLVVDEINALAPMMNVDGGETRMPYSVDEMSARLVTALDTFSDSYGILTNYSSRVKPVYFSTVMSDLQISGIYSFFTGEANVNVEYPDYCLPFTAAHELAHQRGICRENEANFVAFLVCIGSEDDYIRYSGYLNVYEYLASALYRADKELYKSALERLSGIAIYDMRASDAIYYAHKDSILGKINDRLNDAYLKANGTEGIVSYGYVVRLAVGYYQKENNK